MKKAFTLIELLVAMAVLALMIAFASMVFTVSIDTYRLSMATAEIMQKLRVVTDQLDADFKGLRKDAPLLVWFQQSNTDPNRYDQIMFFADGDFSSIQLYNNGRPDPVNGDTVIRGNVARVFYGQANVNNVDPWNQTGRDERRRILARRQHILTDDQTVEAWPNTNVSNLGDTYDTDNQTKEDRYEHDRLSLAQWKVIDGSAYSAVNSVIDKSFNTRATVTSDSRTFHKLFCQGIGSIAIQWAYWDTLNGNDRFYWFPSRDPDGADGSAQSHFILRGKNAFGVYFNAPAPDIGDTDWYTAKDVEYRSGNKFAPDFFPTAVKFTFTLYDSKGVIRDGMVFSHIVYLEQ